MSAASVDLNMRALVKLVESIPGIETLGSCGGHKSPRECQHPKGQWFVSFRAKDLTLLRHFRRWCRRYTIHLHKGPSDLYCKCLRCTGCKHLNPSTWYYMKGNGDPRNVAKRLNVFLTTVLQEAFRE